MRWSILAAHLAFGAAGVISAFALGSWTAERLPPSRPKWAILNTGCWTSMAWCYNDMHAPGFIVSDYTGEQSSLMNFVWCNEYAGAHDPIFINMGDWGFLEAQLYWVERAAARPDVEAIVFAIGPGTTGCFVRSKQTLGAIPVLERLRREYPEAAGDVDVFLGCLYASEGYRRALAEYGDRWRDRFEPEAGGLGTGSRGSKARQLADDYTEFASRLRENAVERRLGVPADRYGEPIGRRAPRSGRVADLLDACAAHYLDPENARPMGLLPKGDLWQASGGEAAWRAWAAIVAKVCKARGKKLIIYIPPHLQATPEEYRTRLKPEYVDRVRATFRPFDNVTVIDHADGRTLTPSDTVWHSASGIKWNNGVIPNVIGRLKLSRLLIAEFLEAGLLRDRDGVPRYRGGAWPGEAALPRTSLAPGRLSESDMAIVEDYVVTKEARERSAPAAAASPAGGPGPRPDRR